MTNIFVSVSWFTNQTNCICSIIVLFNNVYCTFKKHNYCYVILYYRENVKAQHSSQQSYQQMKISENEIVSYYKYLNKCVL